jgi:hypothetical protein
VPRIKAGLKNSQNIFSPRHMDRKTCVFPIVVAGKTVVSLGHLQRVYYSTIARLGKDPLCKDLPAVLEWLNAQHESPASTHAELPLADSLSPTS